MRRESLTTPAPAREIEERAYGRGFHLVAGVDEAGRGCLAGPVVAAAVILPRGVDIEGVKDSKLLSEPQREACHARIAEAAVAIGIGSVDPARIDRINILQAAFLAMVQAVESLALPPDYLLIDGPYRLPLPIEHEGIPHGDRICLSIAAASIVAKVTRDRLMRSYHQAYPHYGFDRNKGYGTAAHLDALRRIGPCAIHRLSFRGAGPMPTGRAPGGGNEDEAGKGPRG